MRVSRPAPQAARFAAAISTVTVVSCGLVCTIAAQPVRLSAGLVLIAAFACAVWLLHARLGRRGRSDAIVAAVGLTVVFLVLAGLALAAAHVLSTVPAAITVAVATLAASWVGASGSGSGAAATAGTRLRTPANPIAIAGALVFVVAAALAVYYSAVSATADTDAASSVAIWAYPAGGTLHVGVELPAGRAAEPLRVVVTQAGAQLATWNDVSAAPGRPWEAPALTVTGTGPVQVVALHGTTVVASLSTR